MSSGGRERMPVAVLISGRGSNMMSIVEAADSDTYPARIVAVISNRPDAAGIAWAEARNIPTAVVDHTAFSSREAFEDELHKVLVASGAELVVCAGFMRIMTESFVTKWDGRMLNIHPSLLPSFKGLHTHAKAIEAGVRIAGCSVHYVTADLDGGPIIAQAAVAVRPDDDADSLAARVLAAEHKLYPAALRLVAGGYAPIVNGRVALRADVSDDACLLSPDIAE